MIAFGDGKEIVDDEIRVLRIVNQRKTREQILKMKIEDDGILFTTIKYISPNHWKIKERCLDFDDFIYLNNAIRFINRRKN